MPPIRGSFQMSTKTDHLFGRIAINAGLVTEAQVDECIRLQETLREWKPLGQILIERGYTTESEVRKLLDLQRQKLNAEAVRSRERRADSLFGKLVVRFGYATEEQVNEALTIQATDEKCRNLRLGELLVARGYISADHIQRILAYQKGKLVNCPQCSLQHNVILFQSGEEILCHRCSAKIVVP